MKRTIAVVTSSRADYSHLYWVLRDLEAHPEVDLKVIVLAAHLSPEFGSTVREIERDGFQIASRIECLLSSDSDVGMAKTLGLAVLGLTDALAQMRPDLLLLIADRYEMLAPASVALTLRIPVAHIEGGEISEGAIDDAVRNALTKLAHIHFTSTDTARDRVISMGEEPWRVHRAGAPSLDHIRRSALLTRVELENALELSLADVVTVVAYHPVTIFKNTTVEADAVFAALEGLSGQIIFCYPNADAGSHELMARIQTFLRYTSRRSFVYQSCFDHILESFTRGDRDAWELQQRHHGGCVLCTARDQRGDEAARSRAGSQYSGCGGDRRVHPEPSCPVSTACIPPEPSIHGEHLWRWTRC